MVSLSISDLRRAWLLRQLGLSSSTLTESDLNSALFSNSNIPPYGFPYTIDPGNVRLQDSITWTASQAVYIRTPTAGNVSKVGLSVSIQSGNICVGFYRNSGIGRNAVPGTRIATTGAVACPGTGYQEIALDTTVTVNAGDWFGISADNATVQFLSLLATSGLSDLGKGRQYRQVTAYPLPTTPSGLAATLGYNPIIVGVE